MNNFDFYSPTRFVFGAGRENETGQWVRAVGGSRVLIHYGGGSVIRSGLLERVVRSLDEAGIWSIQLGGVQPNPRDTMVYDGIELCRREKIDLVLGIGGGSALDSAKAIAIGTCYDGDFRDIYLGKAKPVGRLLLGTIITLPATGSEGSNSSVIYWTANRQKRGLRSDLNRPDFSVMNPELTYSLPPWQIACGASDIISHALERYFTKTTDVDVTDRLCEAVIATVLKMAGPAIENPKDYGPRANLMWASTIAHNGSLGIGRQEDWSVHAMEAEIGAKYDTAHGAGLSALNPAWLQRLLPRDPSLLAQLSARVFGVPMDEADPAKTARAGIRALVRFYQSLGLPVSLQELGVRREDLAEMTKNVKRNPSGTCGYYEPLTTEDVLELYEQAFDWSLSRLD